MPPNIEECFGSITCTFRTALGTVIPVLVIFIAALRLLGVRSPEIAIFTEFLSEDDVAAGAAEEAADQTKPKPPRIPEQAEFASDDLHPHADSARRPNTRRQIALTAIALLETIGWTWSLVSVATSGNPSVFLIVTTAIPLGAWTYAFLRPLVRPSVTPYYDLFVLYLSQLLASCLSLYEASTTTSGDVHHSFRRVAITANALAILLGLGFISNMPLEATIKPALGQDGLPPANDDYCTLLEWMTSGWIGPLINLGTLRPLNEKDVWELSRTMRTGILMRKFFQIKRKTLVRQVLAANALDLFLSLFLTLLSTTLSFATPFFLSLTLRAMTPELETVTGDLMTTGSTHSPSAVSLGPFPLSSFPRITDDSQVLIAGTSTSYASRPLQKSDAYLFAIAVCLCQILKSQCDLQYMFYARRASVRVKSELVASVYEKALKRKDISGAVQQENESKTTGKDKTNSAEGQKSTKDSGRADMGKIISLISSDANLISRSALLGPYVYNSLFSIVLACTMLYGFMGWTAFAGYLVMVVALPLNAILVRRTSSIQRSVSSMRDRRMRAMNEVIQAIKFIKYSAWELRWAGHVLDARRAELQWLWKLKAAYFFLGMVWDIIPMVVSAISFGFFTLVAKRELTVDIAFPCIAVFGMLSQSLTVLPMLANIFLSTRISLNRIEQYLGEDEVPDYVSSLKRPHLPPHAPVDSRLGFAGATFRWSAIASLAGSEKTQPGDNYSLWSRLLVFFKFKQVIKADQGGIEDSSSRDSDTDRSFELKSMDVIFPEGSISLVCGPTGSGKSSLLSALLGEMDLIEGEAYLPKEPNHLNEKTGLPTTVSYCAQQPWLEHKSIKENILFGSALDQERYDATLSCCALLPDLDILEDGDETEIGEKGVSLSGGQKARVALARAVYARTQVVLLDDVLSAVDCHTAEHIVQNCFQGPLMKGRTVVLATHHVDLVLPSVNWVLKLSEGRINEQGTAEELHRSISLAEALAEQRFKVEEVPADAREAPAANEKDLKKPGKKLVEEEAKSSGSVKMAIYKTYLKAASYWLMSLVVLCLAAGQLMQVAQKFWIKRWSESYESTSNRFNVTNILPDLELPSATHSVVPYLLVYIGIQGVVSIISIITQVPSILSAMRASHLLYEQMLQSVMRATSRFFDRTPSGRILNRFSKDIDAIDGGLQDLITSVITYAAILVVAVATIVYAVPFFIFPAVIVAYLHLWFARGYIGASRDLRRIEANARSPIISSFSELLVGIVTVRAFGTERTFLRAMYQRLDRAQAATHYYWACNRWLMFRFDTLGAVSVLIATIGSLFVGTSAGLTGVIITQAQQYVYGLYWGLRNWTELEQSLNSIERIQEYLNLPSEPPGVIESNRPPAGWPSSTKGELVIEDLVVKYAPDLDPVLYGISFTAKPAEKIGIVGRTGSGKSTLALALFRFVDPTAGSITLDGIDITTIGLSDLRSRLTLIPQDAVLFGGTIRENLDPFNEYTDAECIEVLNQVHLPTTESSLQAPRDGIETDGGAESSRTLFTLETKVSDGGNNFSHGQRQLLSMARALLRKSSVIVMDESTASVDFETDAKIQHTIREEFGRSILLTIAHRLRTVIDNDRILVLNAGRVVEFDTPLNLLTRQDGVFHDMCRKSGDYEQLLHLVQSKE